jgi:hypothetical protein
LPGFFFASNYFYNRAAASGMRNGARTFHNLVSAPRFGRQLAEFEAEV